MTTHASIHLEPTPGEHLPTNYPESGFAILPGVVSRTEIDALRAELTALHSSRTHADADFTRPDGKSHIKDVLLRSGRLADSLMSEAVFDALRQILGEDFIVLFHSESHYRSYFPAFHQDSAYIEREIGNDVWKQDFNILKVSLYLQEHSSLYGGGLEILPATHTRRYTDERGVMVPWRTRSEVAKQLYWKLHYRALYHDRVVYRWAHSKAERLIRGPLPRGVLYPRNLGDIAIFDHRIVHRATLGTKAPAQLRPDQRKHAVYMTVARNNEHAFQFAHYLSRRHSSAYGRGLEYPEELVERCRHHRVNLMKVDAQGNPDLMCFSETSR